MGAILASAYLRAACMTQPYDKAPCVDQGWSSFLVSSLITGNNVRSGNNLVTATNPGGDWYTLDPLGANYGTFDTNVHDSLQCIFTCEYVGIHSELEFGECQLPYTKGFVFICGI
jgi:hypothetical protein